MKKLMFFSILMTSSLSLASANYDYTCSPVRGSEIMTPEIALSLNSTTLIMTVLQASPNGYSQSFSRDLNYKPRNGNKVRFGTRWDYVVISAEMLTGGLKLNNGKLGGFASIGGEEDGGWNESRFTCYRVN